MVAWWEEWYRLIVLIWWWDIQGYDGCVCIYINIGELVQNCKEGSTWVEPYDWRKLNPGLLVRRPAIGPPSCSRSPTKHWWHWSYARPCSQAWSAQSSFFNLWNLGTGLKFQDIIFNFEKAYFILDELLMAGEMQVWFCFIKLPIAFFCF